MYHLKTSTLGMMDTVDSQNEYMLVVASVDCAMRNKGEWIADVMTWFKAEYIRDVYFRKLFTCVVEMFDDGEPITDYVLASKLKVDGSLFGKKAADMYGLVTDSKSQGGHIAYYAKCVYDVHRRAAASEELAGAATDIQTSPQPDDILDELPAIRNKYSAAPEDRVESNADVMQEILADLEGNAKDDLITFGIESLDRAVSLKPSSLVTFSAPTSGGKSVVLGQIALNCALRHRKSALLFSYEMSAREVYTRWAASLCRYPPPPNRSPGENIPLDWDRKRFIDGLSQVRNFTDKDGGLLQVFAGGSRTIEQLAHEAKSFAGRVDLGVVVVDYCQLVHVTDGSVQREQQVAHIINQLKRLAMEIGVPVVTASQVNEDGKTRESRAILNASNVLIHIEPDGSPESSVTEITMEIRKNRDGERRKVHAFWDKPLFLMRDLDSLDSIALENPMRTYRDY